MELKLPQLKTFLCIVRLGSFAAAARHLHATQSAVSVRIQELEQALGVTLMLRASHGVTLTPKGRELVPFAEQLLALATRARDEIGDPAAATGTVRVGVCEPIALTWLPNYIEEARSRFPKVSIEIDRDLSTGLVAKLRQGEVDLGLVAGPVSEGGFVASALGRVRYSWMASPGLKVPRGTLTPQEIRQLPLISLSQQPYEYPAIERWLGGAEHKFVITCNDIGMAIQLLARGMGISLLAEVCCTDLIESGRLKVLKASPPVPQVGFFAVSRRSQHHPLVTSFAALAEEVSGFQRPKRAPIRRH